MKKVFISLVFIIWVSNTNAQALFGVYPTVTNYKSHYLYGGGMGLKYAFFPRVRFGVEANLYYSFSNISSSEWASYIWGLSTSAEYLLGDRKVSPYVGLRMGSANYSSGGVLIQSSYKSGYISPILGLDLKITKIINLSLFTNYNINFKTDNSFSLGIGLVWDVLK